MNKELYVGSAEVDITPELGALLQGSLKPRKSNKVLDPLKIKSVVLKNSRNIIAYIILDLIGLDRKTGEEGLRTINEQNNIPMHNIFWSTTHTHSGPYTWLNSTSHEFVNDKWLKLIPERMAECVGKANKNKRLVKIKYARGFFEGLAQNRRVRFKDGREINNWLLENKNNNIQSIGNAGVIDPEILTIAFEDEIGISTILFQTSIHANANRNLYSISGDYPSIVAKRLSEKYGSRVTTLYFPGACGDINPVRTHKYIGNKISKIIIDNLESSNNYEDSIELNGIKKEVKVPLIDYNLDYEDRMKKTQYSEKMLDFFRKNLEVARRIKQKEKSTIIQAWRIGRFGFVSLPGEMFSEIGLRIKERSPFDWTFPVNLGGESLGYLITKRAWKAGGYETLIGELLQPPSPEGVEKLEKEALEVLNHIYQSSSKKIQKK